MEDWKAVKEKPIALYQAYDNEAYQAIYRQWKKVAKDLPQKEFYKVYDAIQDKILKKYPSLSKEDYAILWEYLMVKFHKEELKKNLWKLGRTTVCLQCGKVLVLLCNSKTHKIKEKKVSKK